MRRKSLNAYYTSGHNVASLPRLQVYCLTLKFLFFATENKVIKTPPALTTVARLSCLLAFVFDTILFTIGLPAETNWCCYSPSTNIADLDLGICPESQAPIHKSARYERCTASSLRPETWVIIGLAGITTFIWVILTVIRFLRFKNSLTHAITSDEKFIFSIAEEHADKIARASSNQLHHEDVAKILTSCVGALDELNDTTSSSVDKDHTVTTTQSALLLERTREFMFDLSSFALALPAWVQDAHVGVIILQITLNIIWLGCLVLIWTVSLPKWRRTCCYSGHMSHTAWHGLGHCDDPSGYAHRSEIAQECNWQTFTWDLWMEFVIGGLALLFALVHYAAICVAYSDHSKIMIGLWLHAVTESIVHANITPDVVAAGSKTMRAQLGKQFRQLASLYARPPPLESTTKPDT
jgi:hypothetical protein